MILSVSRLTVLTAPPVPSREAVDTISEGELKSGKEGLLMVPFHANPEPENMTWYLDDLKYPLGLNESSERYTSRGWMRYVSNVLICWRGNFSKISSQYIYSESQLQIIQ